MMFPDTLNKLADGLAEQGFAVIDNFLLPDEVNAILQLDEFQNGLLQFKKAGIGHQQENRLTKVFGAIIFNGLIALQQSPLYRFIWRNSMH